jgi:hypothetical protein
VETVESFIASIRSERARPRAGSLDDAISDGAGRDELRVEVG